MAKTIVITGAGDGLGRALARRFGADGDNVVLLGRTFSKVESVAAGIGPSALPILCDISSPDSVRAAFAKIAEHHSSIDVLINNAAIYEPFTIEEATDEQIVGGVSTNLIGPLLCARSATPMMGPGAHIINVSSESTDMPFPFFIIYQCTKAGLENFSHYLHQELMPRKIRVTTVRCGQMMDEAKAWKVEPEMQKRFTEQCMANGLVLRERPISQFSSVTDAFRAMLDLPKDLHPLMLSLEGRRD